MTLWVDVARVAIVLNLTAMAALLWLWARTYRALGSRHSLGLLVFGSFLFLENAFGLYFYFFHEILRVWVAAVPPVAQGAMTLLRVLEFLGIVALLWTSWD